MKMFAGTKLKVRRSSITTGILFITLAVMLLALILLGSILYVKSKNTMNEQFGQKARNAAKCAAALTDGDMLERLRPGMEESDEYFAIRDRLDYVYTTSDVTYLYTVVKDDSGNFVYAVDPDREAPCELFGECTDDSEGIVRAWNGETCTNDEPTEDEWGVFITSYSPIENSAGKIVGLACADVDYEWILEQNGSIIRTVIITIVAAVAFLMLGMMFIKKKLDNGFGTLNSKVAELADGTGNLNKRVELMTGDEFEVIAGNINAFIEEVQKLVGEVAKLTKVNASTVDDMNDVAVDISANMEECSASCTSMNQNLENTAGHMDALNGDVGAVEKFVAKANSDAVASSTAAEKQQAVASEKIRMLKEKLDISAERASDIRKIAKITEEINGFATQTRLLSLNAQIEAAHAGMFGRGFAVVATSVQTLSDDIGKAVNEITEVNTNVLSAVSDLLDQVNEMTSFLMETVLSDYDAFAKQGNNFSEASNAILGYVEKLKEKSAEVTRELGDVAHTVNDISKAVADSADRTTKLSMSSADISGSMQDMMNIAFLKSVCE